MSETALFDADLVQRYGLNGPRYTSYPTAVSFHEGFDELAYREQALQSNEDFIPRPLSLYLHLPFCHSLCYYCGCNKKITRHSSHGEDYLHWLQKEICMQAELFDSDREVLQIHLGGGTPTFFDDDQLAAIMRGLSSNFHLSMAPQREFSIEIDPRTVDTGRVRQLARLGFNRLSLGVQDLDPRVQQAVNRVQDPQQTLDLIGASREAGFNSISIDLIYGLPKQTLESFRTTLEVVIEARPDRLSVYNYAHLPELFRAQRLIKDADLPVPEVRLALLQCTIETLAAAGYLYIGMDHFALPDNELVRARDKGQLQRNFQGYSTFAECDLLGLGVSAISKVGDSYSQNFKDLINWRHSLKAGDLPVWRGVELSREDSLRRSIIEQIMCHGALDFDRIETQFGIDFGEHFAAELVMLKKLAWDGLLRLSGSGLRATSVGMLLVRVIAMVFDESLKSKDQERAFSKVI